MHDRGEHLFAEPGCHALALTVGYTWISVSVQYTEISVLVCTYEPYVAPESVKFVLRKYQRTNMLFRIEVGL